MAGSVVVEQTSVSVVPGEMGTCTVRVRNTGTVVDQFTLTVLGQPSAWTTVVPAALSLFPNADGVIELHFAPPRAPGVGAGPTPFGVRVVGSEDADNAVVEEGEVVLLPFVDVTAKVTPRTSETKRKARHEIVLDNKGNGPISVSLSVSDPDEQLAFELKESTVSVDAGQSRHVPLKVAARKGFAKGADKHRPFQVTARPEGSPYPLVMDANLIQKAGLPRFVLPLVAGAVAIALIAAVVPGMLGQEGSKGTVELTNSDSPVTTVAAVDEGAVEDENAAATPEEAAAAAAAELAANGKDGDGGAAGVGGGGDTSVAGTGGGSTAGSGGGSGGGGSNTGGETTGVTSPSATVAPAPGGGTTATTAAGGSGSGAGTTPTTAAGGGGSGGTTPTTTATTSPPVTEAPARSTSKNFYGSWNIRAESFMSIVFDRFTRQISVKAEGPSIGSFTCTGSTADADDDGVFTGSCSDDRSRSFTHTLSTDTIRMTNPNSPTLCKGTCTVTWTRG